MPARSEARPATAADHDRVVDTVVAAFDRDPGFRWFFADPTTFTVHATAFVDALLRPRLAAGGVWVVDDGAAVAMWERPGAGPADLDRVLPPAVHDRLRRWEDAAHRFLPSSPHWYLGILATHPARSGEGLGRRAAAPGIEQARAEGLSCWLETASPANVAMYERRGWTVAGAVDVDGVTCTVLSTG